MPDVVTSRPIVKRPSRLWGWLRALDVVLQSALLIGIVSVGIRHCVVAARLDAELAKMDRTDPGWRLHDVEAARAAVPDAENAALVVIDLGKKLPKPPRRWIEADFDEQLQKTPPAAALRPEQLAHLRQCLAEIGPSLDEAKTLVALPKGRFPIVYARNPLNTLLEGEQQTREVCRLLNLNAMACAEVRDAHAAISSCHAALNAARSIGDEPTGISQLIRIATVISTCKMMERILAQDEPDDADLKDIQALLEEEDTFPYWDVTLRGERAFQNGSRSRVRRPCFLAGNRVTPLCHLPIWPVRRCV